MPLHDHFRPPMADDVSPRILHVAWGAEIARRLNSHWLREPFRARQHESSGSELRIDITTQEHREPEGEEDGGGGAATMTAVWAPPAALAVGVAVFPEMVEVRVYEGTGGWHLVGAVEIISRSNKNTPARRTAFLGKCASYLRAGASLVMIDIVTDRHRQMHNALLDLIRIPDGRMPAGAHLCASAYRPVQRQGRDEIDVWAVPFRLGEELPTMPLRLTGDLFVPIEFELTYLEALRAQEAG